MAKSIHRPEYDLLREMLRQARLDAGVTQGQLSDALGRSQSFVSDVERGVRRIDLLELSDVCFALGVDFAEFSGRFSRRIDRWRRSKKRGRQAQPG